MLRKMLMGIVMLALLAPIASAQTVDELLAKHFEAKGGLAKIKAVKSMRMTGKMVLPQGIEIPVVMYEKRPKSFRMEFSFQGMQGIQAYDGKNAWGVSPMSGKKDPEAMDAEGTKQAEEQSDMDGPLVDYKDKGNTVELIGKEPVEGVDAYKLKVTLKGGDVRYVYLDAETYLEIKTEAKRTIRGTEVESESYMSDFKEVNGLMIPFAVEQGAKGQPQRQKIVIEKVETDPEISDSLFVMPAAAAAADSTQPATPAAKAAADPKTPVTADKTTAVTGKPMAAPAGSTKTGSKKKKK